jgi:hypothetical protein
MFLMPSKISGFVMSEPSGRPAAAVMFSGALLFVGMYVYFGVFGDSSTTHELFLAGSFALSGIAESLPKDRRRTAGILRVTAILIPLSMIAIIVIAPEIINSR